MNKVSLQSTFFRALQALNARVPYTFGGKLEIGLPVEYLNGRGLDCSGFVRWLIGDESFPDGSESMREYCSRNLNVYKSEGSWTGALRDGHLRIGFLSPDDGNGIGHVVLLYGGSTIECYGGHGVGMREFIYLPFRRELEIYLLPIA